MKENLLEVCGLKTYFRQEDRIFKAVDGVDFTVRAGEILGIVGESGCGKSVTSLSIMRLLGEKGYIAGGKILLDGTNLLELSEAEMTQVRGHKIAMIFQDPMVSLNPVYSVGDQIAEAIRAHTKVSKKEAYERALEMLKKVGIPSSEQRLKEYPHQLLIADEPTTALDVTIQAQILQLLRDLNRDLGMSIMLITHDLGVIAEICDRVVVMYAGKVMESADVKTLFRKPLHPYTNGLLQAIPSGNKCVDGKELFTIPGMVPSPDKFPEGCRFADRCPHANEQCRAAQPELKDMGENHLVACTRLNQSETLA